MIRNGAFILPGAWRVILTVNDKKFISFNFKASHFLLIAFVDRWETSVLTTRGNFLIAHSWNKDNNWRRGKIFCFVWICNLSSHPDNLIFEWRLQVKMWRKYFLVGFRVKWCANNVHFQKNDNVTLMNGIGEKHTFLKYDLTVYEMTYVDQLHVLLFITSSVSIGNRPPN